MSLNDLFFDRARKRPARVAYPEGHDPRIVEAAVKARQMGIAIPVLVGNPAEVTAIASRSGWNLDGITVLSPKDDGLLDRFADDYARTRNLRTAIARKVVQKPLSFAGMIVKTGMADAMVGGVDTATASMIQAASLTIGLQPGITTPSSCFVMIVPDFQGEKEKALIFADCGLNIQPTAAQLADIALASASSARSLLGVEPRVAMLSFSTKGSGSHADVDKVLEALSIVRAKAPFLIVDGELQGDAALSPRVGEKKAKGSPVAGQANVLIFPDLNSGNICYKLTQYLAKATALGPLLQGFARPANDMSRGATVDDLIGVTAITSIQAQGA